MPNLKPLFPELISIVLEKVFQKHVFLFRELIFLKGIVLFGFLSSLLLDDLRRFMEFVHGKLYKHHTHTFGYSSTCNRCTLGILTFALVSLHLQAPIAWRILQPTPHSSWINSKGFPMDVSSFEIFPKAKLIFKTNSRIINEYIILHNLF